jgi:hypothetical protein
MKRLQTLLLLSAAAAACGGPQPGTDAGTDASQMETGPRPDVVADTVVRPDVISMPDADMTDGSSMPDADTTDAMSMPDVSCPIGQTACSGTCIDTQTDNANCGGCGNACSAGQTCMAGVCTCPMGQMTCSGACVDTQTDNANCGACGNACPVGQTCMAGACRVDCMAPRTICGMGAGQTCVDTQTDNANCGSCGNACPAGQGCVSGACRCPMGSTACGMPAMCVNTQTDTNNCGACGNVCGAGQSCNAGVCTCPAGRTRCGMGASSTCVNTQTDNANCGGCGVPCASGRVCAAGTCQASCTGATPNLCGMGAMSFCTNFQTDNSNCGTCGNVCGANATCTAGTCRPSNDTVGTAAVLPFELNTRRLVTGSTVGAANDTGACAGSNNTVYYRIDVITRSIVYVETFGSTTNTVVGFRPLGTGSSVSCNDNACGGMQSQSAIVADVGALIIEVGNAAGGAGAFTMRYTIQPAGAGDVTAITPTTTTQTVIGATTATNGVAQSCGSATSAGEDAFYFMTCPADPARRLHVSTCGSYYDTLVEQRSVGAAAVCNDDAGNGECQIAGGGTVQQVGIRVAEFVGGWRKTDESDAIST